MTVFPLLTFIFLAVAAVTNAWSLTLANRGLPTVKERKLAFQKEFLDLLMKFEDILPDVQKEFDLPESAMIDSGTVDIVENNSLVEDDTTMSIQGNQKISDDKKDARVKRSVACGSNRLPSGLTEDAAYRRLDFDKNGISETVAAILNLDKVLNIKRLAEQSEADTEHRYNEGLHNGEGDAFRHALWMYRVTRVYGYKIAKTFGDAHERSHPNPVSERLMDLFNNEVGRCLGLNSANYGISDYSTFISSAIAILQTSRDVSYPTEGFASG
ncbi:uncharacterized protein LOC144451585 [Glandiceps talaboti]